MNILSAIIILTPGYCDEVILNTDLPDSLYPFKGTLTLKFSTAQNSARDYLRKCFPEVEIVDIIDRAGER